ncbi:hypothetical protein OGM63_21405 [Plectonema radiosum NIES-515]|uniref:Uncharacterized protein n=1 Tax=Plectonema radiosum NIES-515 TaxID=2986073 RepID=A0ABT3B3T0_9CYAN|nr:hypothetical protein [Plectonema radiosum]MCV3216035.1 hypothetical protein [Plectonema radiosum NIES-515]
MADFPSFGNANRGAPPTQRDNAPNIQFAVNVNNHANSLKTAVIGISITNLKTELVVTTLERIFAYTLESANNDLNLSPTLEEIVVPTIHFEVDINKTLTQGLDSSNHLPVHTTLKTANIDILIENLAISLLASALQRIKTYMAAAVAADLNP